MTAIEQLRSGLTIGHFGLGMHGDGTGTPKQQTHDGDTISVKGLGNFSVRCLAIDTPEISFCLPNAPDHFIKLNDPKWKAFLSDPFNAIYGDLTLEPGLKANLLPRLHDKTAENHYNYALKAERELEKEIIQDMTAMGLTKESFQFFLFFAHEVTDRYGRLLAYINRQASSLPYPSDYNTRQLEKGIACPYQIWPNVGTQAGHVSSIKQLVLAPGTAHDWAQKDKYIRRTRELVSNARNAKVGIFDPREPLEIEPFEVRYLAGRRAPERWVIDLSKNDDVLVPPQNYYRLRMEDRLFVPEEYVPLFEERGWKRQ